MQHTLILVLALGFAGCSTLEKSGLWSRASDEQIKQWELADKAEEAYIEALKKDLDKYRNTPPECSSEAECRTMWIAAQAWLANNTKLKIQSASDAIIETYNPPQHSTWLAGRIVRTPQPSGGYTLSARFWCNNIFACEMSPATKIAEFNRAMTHYVKKEESAKK